MSLKSIILELPFNEWEILMRSSTSCRLSGSSSSTRRLLRRIFNCDCVSLKYFSCISRGYILLFFIADKRIEFAAYEQFSQIYQVNGIVPVRYDTHYIRDIFLFIDFFLSLD